MLYEKDKFWFAQCDGGCKKEFPFYSSNKLSAMWTIIDDGWEVHPEDRCYCPKCLKKIKTD